MLMVLQTIPGTWVLTFGWMTRLDYGSQWPLEIQRQLDSWDAFILIMTPRSFVSDWVQSELQRTKRKAKPVFPCYSRVKNPGFRWNPYNIMMFVTGGYPV
jgi:hypothetical protein